MTQQTPDSPSRFTRGPDTLAIYALLALLTSGYGIIGPLMPFLRADLGLSYTQGSYHSVALSLGTSLTALAGRQFQRWLGRMGSVAGVLLSMAAGLLLMCLAPHVAVSMMGAALLGMSIALAVGVAPAVMAERHGPRMGIAMAEANLIAYLGIFLVPGVVSLTSQITSWRWSFLVPVLCYAVFWLLIRRVDLGAGSGADPRSTQERLPAAYWFHWSFLGLTVACEFCMVIWGASYLESVTQLPRDLALWSSMVFPAGVIVGRTVGSILSRRFPAETLVPSALLLAGAGLLLFLMARTPLSGLTGLFLTGVGMANFYPLGITLAMIAAGPATDAAAARASLASGIASLAAPLLVGAIADRAGMGVAFSILPLFLVVAAVLHYAGLKARRLTP